MMMMNVAFCIEIQFLLSIPDIDDDLVSISLRYMPFCNQSQL